jgi:glycosyltransferase involved in cell wall biosynthesis
VSATALLAPRFWPESGDEDVRFVRQLADGLLAEGLKPTLITSHPGRPRRTVEDGLAVQRLTRPPQGRLLRRRFVPYLTHVPVSAAALSAGNYGLAHATHLTDAAAATRWRKRTGRPALLTHLAIPDFRTVRAERRHRELLSAALEQCDAVVAPSRMAAEAFRWWFGYDAPVIAPGVDLRRFRLGAHRATAPTILCLTASTDEIASLLRAFPLIRRERSEASLVLARHGAPALKQAGVPLDAAGIVWRDLEVRSALARAAGEAWVAVLPVRHPSASPLAEALACGTPVVGHPDGAAREVIDSPELGRLFNEATPRAVAESVLEALDLAEDPATAGRCRARAEEFSAARTAEAYVALYRRFGC